MYPNSTLALAVVGDQAVGHRCGVERVFDVGSLGRMAATQGPSVQAASLSAE
jgi:hypothetical protein